MPKHILIVADGRSPTSKSWIKNIQALDYRVSLLSTFPCDIPDGISQFNILPVALSRFSSSSRSSAEPISGIQGKSWVRRFAPLLQKLRYIFGPLSLYVYARKYRQIVRSIEPDLVHALRIPFEGMLARFTPNEVPLVIATWGNDLTLHAKGSFLMRTMTNHCLSRANGLTSDTQRDIRLAPSWGLSSSATTLKVPGSGGLNLREIQEAKGFKPDHFKIPSSKHWVVNPRGLRPGSVHQDTFIKAIPEVLKVQPDTVFLCPNLSGSHKIDQLIKSLSLKDQIFLLPKLTQSQLWSLFKQASVFVSPSSHDGTPNALLEAMACGCFPVAGDIQSIREWIIDGENGFLVNPREPIELANAIIEALDQPALREKASAHNQSLIKTTAAQSTTRAEIHAFYEKLLLEF